MNLLLALAASWPFLLALVLIIQLVYPARRKGSFPRSVLFKTLSAAVYGIDAYLLEVEVDVGSARMNDFNVRVAIVPRRFSYNKSK